MGAMDDTDSGVASVGCLPVSLGPFADWAGQWMPVKDIADRTSISADVLAVTGECIHIVEEECVPWLRNLVTPAAEAPWADVFAEVHATALDRFTCWGHSSNARYPNTGTRIDYVIVDRETFRTCVVQSPSDKLPGGVPVDGDDRLAKGHGVLATSEEAARNAATHFNGWHPAASVGLAQGDGLGPQVDNMRLNDSQFPEKPYTGLIYTPPSYSDHIPVSALFNDILRAPAADVGSSEGEQSGKVNDSQIRQTQPWLGQPSISAFFKSIPSRAATKSGPGAPAVGSNHKSAALDKCGSPKRQRT